MGWEPEWEGEKDPVPIPSLCPPSPLPAPENAPCDCVGGGGGVLIHPDARGCDGDTPEPTQTCSHSVWPRGSGAPWCAHRPAAPGFSSMTRWEVGSRVPGGPPWRSRGVVRVQEGGEEVPDRAGAQSFSVLSSPGEMDAATPPQRRDFPAVFVTLPLLPATLPASRAALRPQRPWPRRAPSSPCPFIWFSVPGRSRSPSFPDPAPHLALPERRSRLLAPPPRTCMQFCLRSLLGDPLSAPQRAPYPLRCRGQAT